MSGELSVVRKDVEHKLFAADEVRLLLIEPSSVVNTVDSKIYERTAPNDICT